MGNGIWVPEVWWTTKKDIPSIFFFSPHSSPYINIFCWKIFQWNQWFYSFTVMSRFHLCFGVIKKNDNIITFKFSTKLDACYLKKKNWNLVCAPKWIQDGGLIPFPGPTHYRACKFLFKNWFKKIWKILFQNEIGIIFCTILKFQEMYMV